MTEEQRYKESIQIEKDKVMLLKRIAVAVETIADGVNMANTKKPFDILAAKLIGADDKTRTISFGVDLCSGADSEDNN